MITRIEIDGFKTFTDFVMEFTPFTVIAGANASGKSNLFDALNLISNLADSDLRTAFQNLRGEANEQFTNYSEGLKSNKIKIAVELLLDRNIRDNWGEEAILKYTRLRYEIEIEKIKTSRGFEDLRIIHEQLAPLKHQEDRWVKKNIDREYLDFWRPKVSSGKRGIPYIFTQGEEQKRKIKIPLDGKPGPGREFLASEISQSALSSVNSVEFRHIYATKTEMLNWRFLQLNPEDLRKPSSRLASDTISHSGENLASTLFRIKQEDEFAIDDIELELNNLLPNFTHITIQEDFAENRFIIKLSSDDGREFTSRVLSEGTLRILVLCILKYDKKYKGILCFEEPENGIHPFRLKMMSNLLFGLTTDFSYTEDRLFLRQIIVNTHSSKFVSEVLNPELSSRTSVWMSKMISRKTPDGKSMYKTTKLLPVKYSDQYNIDFGNASEIQMTTLELEKYLDTNDLGS